MVDVAKALTAAARAGVAPGNVAPGGEVRALAVPTTLSGAEMTSGHRHASGVDEATPRVRPAVVIFDPALAASQPPEELAASSANALGHAVEGPCTVRANPVATLAAHEAARLIAAGWSSGEPDRESLALGALLAGYVIDSTGLGLHHVLAQTLVRVLGAGHGQANAVCCRTRSRRWRPRRDAIAAVRRRRGARRGRLQAIARRDRESPRSASIRRGSDEAAQAAAARPQLANTPPAADRGEILRDL